MLILLLSLIIVILLFLVLYYAYTKIDYVIINAIDTEIELVKFKQDVKWDLIQSEPFKIYKFRNMIRIIGGVGIANGARCMEYISQNFPHAHIIVIGTCGSLRRDLKIKQMCLVEKALFWNADYTGAGFELGQIPFEPLYFNLNSDLKHIQSLIHIDANIVHVVEGSADVFVMRRDDVLVRFPDVEIVNDETASYALVAYKNNIKHLTVLQFVSDYPS